MNSSEFLEYFPEFTTFADLEIKFKSAQTIANAVLGCYCESINNALAIAHILTLREQTRCDNGAIVTSVQSGKDKLEFWQPKDDHHSWLVSTSYGLMLAQAITYKPTFTTL
jgi:hypothetical protein